MTTIQLRTLAERAQSLGYRVQLPAAQVLAMIGAVEALVGSWERCGFCCVDAACIPPAPCDCVDEDDANCAICAGSGRVHALEMSRDALAAVKAAGIEVV